MDGLKAPCPLFPEPPDNLISLLFSWQSHRLEEESDQVAPSPARVLNRQPVNPLTLNQRMDRRSSGSNYDAGGSCSGKRQKEREVETAEMEGSWGSPQLWPQPGAGDGEEEGLLLQPPEHWRLGSIPSSQSSATRKAPRPGQAGRGWCGRGRGETKGREGAQALVVPGR